MSYYFSYSAKSLSKKLKENLMIVTYEKLYNKNKLHCTMLFSNENYEENYSELKLPDIEVTIKNIELWETDSGHVVVATLEGSEVFEMHKKIKENFNIEHQRGFKPHITLQKLASNQLSEAVKLEELTHLIGHKVLLNKFDFHVVSNKPKLKM